jgi:ankyrin repeat protein
LHRTGANKSAADAAGNTALHLAMEEEHEAVAVALLDAGADARQRNGAGMTAVDLAPDNGLMLVRIKHMLLPTSD